MDKKQSYEKKTFYEMKLKARVIGDEIFPG